MTDDPLPPEAQTLPPAAKHIFDHLQKPYVDQRSKRDLIEELYYSRKTVDRAIDTLGSEGLVTSDFCPDDGRSRVYSSALAEE